MTMSHDKAHAAKPSRDSYGYSPGRGGKLFENEKDTISETNENIGYGHDNNVREVGRLSIDERPYHLSGQSRNEREVGRLGIDERAWRPSDPFAPTDHEIGGRLSANASASDESDPFASAGSNKTDGSGFIVETPSNEEKKSDDDKEKEMLHSSTKGKKGPTPARALLPDETEWRDFVSSEPGALFPPESGRYHLYASYACPGSHRALIIRALKGLEDAVSVTIVHPTWRLTKGSNPEERDQRGWVFGDPDGEPFANTAGRGGPFPPAFPGNEPDPIFNASSIREIYEIAGDTAGKYTVPILWDKKQQTIVNNESSDISYMFNSRLNDFADNPDLDLYTEDDPSKLNEAIEWLAPLMIHGVYRCGFAKTQTAYDKAINELTETFDRADAILSKQRYLTGDTLTDADIRLFVTLLRFDEVYAFYFRANSRLVMLTPSLLNYCRDIYQTPGVPETCDMEQIKAHFYASHAEWNKFSIIPRGLGFMDLLALPHDRDEM